MDEWRAELPRLVTAIVARARTGRVTFGVVDEVLAGRELSREEFAELLDELQIEGIYLDSD